MDVRTTTDVRTLFVDAAAGTILLDDSILKTEKPAWTFGSGAQGHVNGLGVSVPGGSPAAIDRRRTATITTYDLQGDAARAADLLVGDLGLGPADVATGSTAVWSDGAVVQAQANAGATYDYYLQRFGRRGLDGRDAPIAAVVHPGLAVAGAVWDGHLLMLGDGQAGRQEIILSGDSSRERPLSGPSSAALDSVAHALTHAVVDTSSELRYRNEPGALSEAFADIVGTAITFAVSPAGGDVRRGDYLAGADAVAGGIRSLARPALHRYPDHVSGRLTSAEDNGSVHANSTIISHAFYLAVEGGTNRTSGIAVEGVACAKRDQIERTFYRAFVYLLTSDASFTEARDATIQLARDLFGDESAALRAIRRAWQAVGIQ